MFAKYSIQVISFVTMIDVFSQELHLMENFKILDSRLAKMTYAGIGLKFEQLQIQCL